MILQRHSGLHLILQPQFFLKTQIVKSQTKKVISLRVLISLQRFHRFIFIFVLFLTWISKDITYNIQRWLHYVCINTGLSLFYVCDIIRVRNNNNMQKERQRCEVWTRCMGYFRPVSFYNIGKKSEHYNRKHFTECAIANGEFTKKFAK